MQNVYGNVQRDHEQGAKGMVQGEGILRWGVVTDVSKAYVMMARSLLLGVVGVFVATGFSLLDG